MFKDWFAMAFIFVMAGLAFFTVAALLSDQIRTAVILGAVVYGGYWLFSNPGKW